ncbi:MAG TPA: long-chain fatty acid--CoA ligase [Thermoanaerobaculia bacterium]|nr:long-chain fatty acid--CoA ligase [Thermoanaerobaculia bacterium]
MQEPKTLTDIYTVTCSIDRPAIMKYKSGDRWVDVSVPEFRDTVRWFAAGLHDLGVKRGDRVGILAENRPEWSMTDFAALCAGAVSVPVYPTLLGWQIEYILNDAGTVAVVCSNQEQLDKVLEIRSHVPTLNAVIVCDAPPNKPANVMTFQEVVDRGRRWEDSHGTTWFETSRGSVKPSDLATLVYTSGTTGNPKGAMLSHGNIASNVNAVREFVPFEAGDTALSILPLSHILERMVDFIYFYKGGCIAYAENVTKVADNLQEVKPEFFAAVPRLFEKMRARVLDNVATAPPARQKIFRWALKVAEERLPHRIEHTPMPFGLKIKSAIADKLVFSKILARLGGNVKYVVSGGAPLSADLAAFFIGAGVEILEGYGLTETSPVIAVNRPDKRRLGSVGPIIQGIEVKIAEDGEILSRGPHIMQGYWNNPEATAQSIDPEGWFHTGDIGEIDSDGFLKITDRKKDIIINAYGKNIAPQPLEALLKSSPYVGTPVLIGDRRKYLTALIGIESDTVGDWATRRGVPFTTYADLSSKPEVRELINGWVEEVNRDLAQVETIKRFALLEKELDHEDGELTATLKVKRRALEQRFERQITDLYV